MTANNFAQVCYRTEQREEEVPILNVNNQELGFSFGCTQAGETLLIRLKDGELDSWSRDDCEISNYIQES